VTATRRTSKHRAEYRNPGPLMLQERAISSKKGTLRHHRRRHLHQCLHAMRKPQPTYEGTLAFLLSSASGVRAQRWVSCDAPGPTCPPGMAPPTPLPTLCKSYGWYRSSSARRMGGLDALTSRSLPKAAASALCCHDDASQWPGPQHSMNCPARAATHHVWGARAGQSRHNSVLTAARPRAVRCAVSEAVGFPMSAVRSSTHSY
jgi:hypothetical protein